MRVKVSEGKHGIVIHEGNSGPDSVLSMQSVRFVNTRQ